MSLDFIFDPGSFDFLTGDDKNDGGGGGGTFLDLDFDLDLDLDLICFILAICSFN